MAAPGARAAHGAVVSMPAPQAALHLSVCEESWGRAGWRAGCGLGSAASMVKQGPRQHMCAFLRLHQSPQHTAQAGGWVWHPACLTAYCSLCAAGAGAGLPVHLGSPLHMSRAGNLKKGRLPAGSAVVP